MNGFSMKLAIAGIGALALFGCSETGKKQADFRAGERPEYQRGMYAYTDFCGECHDSGQHGAPILDDSEAWNGRGREFPTLLRDHEQRGWLRAPEKGVHAELGERSVADAVDYMVGGGQP